MSSPSPISPFEEKAAELEKSLEPTHDPDALDPRASSDRPPRHFVSLRLEDRIGADAKYDIMRGFADSLGERDVAAVLRVVASPGRIGLFEECVAAAGLRERYAAFAHASVEGLLLRDERRRPRISCRGRPLPLSTLNLVLDHFGSDQGYAREALERGAVTGRECHRLGDEDLLLSASVHSTAPGVPSHEVYLDFGLEDGAVGPAQCPWCESWWDDEEDGPLRDHEVACRHGLALALAFLEAPHSFAGCPSEVQAIRYEE